MDEFESLSHTKWECKYHVVFIPKCRRKALYGQRREHLGEVFRRLAADHELDPVLRVVEHVQCIQIALARNTKHHIHPVHLERVNQ